MFRTERSDIDKILNPQERILDNIKELEQKKKTSQEKIDTMSGWNRSVEEKAFSRYAQNLEALKKQYEKEFGKLPGEDKEPKTEAIGDNQATQVEMQITETSSEPAEDDQVKILKSEQKVKQEELGLGQAEKHEVAEQQKQETEEQRADTTAEVYDFRSAKQPDGITSIYEKIKNLKEKELNEKEFVNQVKDFLKSLAQKRRDAKADLEQAITEIQNKDTKKAVELLIKNLSATWPKRVRSGVPDAWNAYNYYYGSLIRELVFLAHLKQDLKFDFVNLEEDYDLQETEPFLALFRADKTAAQKAELAESKKEKEEIKSFNLFKQRALELLGKNLGVHMPSFDNEEIGTKMDLLRLEYIKGSEYITAIESLEYSPENKELLTKQMREYFNGMIGIADELIQTEFKEDKIENIEQIVEFLRNPKNTPYRQSHDFQIKRYDQEESILLPVDSAQYIEEKLFIGEDLPTDIPEPLDSKTPGRWLLRDPQFGYEIQDEWRRYGSTAGIVYNQAEDGKIEIEEVYFHTAEEKEYFFEQLQGKPEDEDQEKREKRQEKREFYRQKAFDYLKGSENEQENDEAQKELQRLIKEFGKSRGWNKKHLAKAYSKKMGIDPPLTGEEFMEDFIKRKGYVFYSEKVLQDKENKVGLSLEGVMLKDALKDLDISEEQKKKLALHFSLNNNLSEPEQGIKDYAKIKNSLDKATAKLSQEELQEILERFQDVRSALVDIGLILKSFDAEGKVAYSIVNSEDVVLIPYKSADGRYTAIRRRLLKDKLSYNYYDQKAQEWKKHIEEINGGLAPGGNKYLSDPRVYSDIEPRELEGTTHNANLLMPRTWDLQEWESQGWSPGEYRPEIERAPVYGKNIVITEGEFKSTLASESTGIPHIAIPGITMVDEELVQKIKEAGPQSATICFDADPDGMAHLRGDLLTDSERAGFRIAKMLEQAGVEAKIAIWPEQYHRRRIKTEIKDIEDLLIRQTDGIEVYQNEILGKAVSTDQYIRHVNTEVRNQDLRYTKMEKLNQTMEQVLALEHDLRIGLKKFITAQNRGADTAPEELNNKVKELEDIRSLLFTLKKESAHFYLGTDLDKPAEHAASLSPDAVPNSKNKYFVTESQELIPAEKARDNIINYRFLPDHEVILEQGEDLHFIDPTDEKQVITPRMSKLNKALDFTLESEAEEKKEYGQIRSDVLSGLCAVEGLKWKEIIPKNAQYAWTQKCLEHDIDEEDLLQIVYSADFDKEAQRIANQCFANAEEKEKLKSLIGRIDDYLSKELEQKEFNRKTAYYVIGNYLLDKFSSDDVRYELEVAIHENKAGALVKRGQIEILGVDSKKMSEIIKFTAEILGTVPEDKDKDAILEDYQENFSKMRIGSSNVINTLRGPYAEQRRENRGVLQFCRDYAEEHKGTEITEKEIKNRDEYLDQLVQKVFEIDDKDLAQKIIDDLGLFVLFPKDFEEISESISKKAKEQQRKKETQGELTEESVDISEKQTITHTALAKAGLLAFYPNGKTSPKFMGPVLIMGKSPSFDPTGKKAPDVGAEIFPLYYNETDPNQNELAQNPGLLLERAYNKPMFPLQGQGNESQRADNAYLEAGHHLSRLKGDGRVVVCFGLPELIREQTEQFSQEIATEDQAVVGINYSLDMLFANIKKILNKEPREIIIVIDDLKSASSSSLLNQEQKPELAILQDLMVFSQSLPKDKDVEIKLKSGNQEKPLKDWLMSGSLKQTDRIDPSTKAGRDKLENIAKLKEYLTQFSAWLKLPVKVPEYLIGYMDENSLTDYSKVDINKLKNKKNTEFQKLSQAQKDQIESVLTWVRKIPGLAQNITGSQETYKEFMAKLLDIDKADIGALSDLVNQKMGAENFSLLSERAQAQLDKIPGIISKEDSEIIMGFEKRFEINEEGKKQNIAVQYASTNYAAKSARAVLGLAA